MCVFSFKSFIKILSSIKSVLSFKLINICLILASVYNQTKMSAALFIVTIPTEKYERNSDTKPKELIKRTSTVNLKDDECETIGNPSTPNMDPKAYGAFSEVNGQLYILICLIFNGNTILIDLFFFTCILQPLSKSAKKSTLLCDAVTVSIDDTTPTSRKIYQKNGSAQKNAIQRTMSFDHGLDSPTIEIKPVIIDISLSYAYAFDLND